MNPEVAVPHSTNCSFRVLLVEDNPCDVDLVREAVRFDGSKYILSVAKDGAEALDILETTAVGEELPDLILLDLSLPRVDGFSVLERIKKDEKFDLIPVVVFTSSQSEGDISHCYSLKANCYVTKPFGLDPFLDTVRSTLQFWCRTARTPSDSKSVFNDIVGSRKF